MPKIGVEQKRRAEVINATLTFISNHGLDGMTLEKVAEYAGCSKGVVAYYFQNKDNLTREAIKAFLAYFGKKIEAEIDTTMAAHEMLQVALNHILPPYQDGGEQKINVSLLDGVERMHIPYADKGKLFVQFFSKAVLDHNLQQVIANSYQADMKGIAKIFDYANRTGELKVADSQRAAYGLFAMVIGLSFFRVANVQLANGEDNRYICEEYLRNFCNQGAEGKSLEGE